MRNSRFKKLRKIPKIDGKAMAFVEKLVVLPHFRRELERVRGWHSIPADGFPISIFDEMVASEDYPRLPAKMTNKKRFPERISWFLLKYNLSITWADFLSDLIVFNHFGNMTLTNQIILKDVGVKSEDLSAGTKDFLAIAKSNPVALFIPPLASWSEVYDYLELKWPLVQEMQLKYRFGNTEISRAKRKNDKIRLRDAYIFKKYKSGRFTKREIIDKVDKKYKIILDYTHLDKIIAAEAKKKRIGI